MLIVSLFPSRFIYILLPLAASGFLLVAF